MAPLPAAAALLTSLLALARLGGWGVGAAQCPPPGTTPHLREILVGRCFDFLTMHSPHVLCGDREVNCSNVADKMIEAFAFQDTCNVTTDRYDAFIAAATHDTTPNKQMFWEGVYGFVNKYSDDGNRHVSIDDTLAGYLGDGLRFCSQPQAPGMILGRDCAGFEETSSCPRNAEYSFWAAASRAFASKARGIVSIMLNASVENAFEENSFFATWELPNINASQATHARILLVHVPGHPIRTTCLSESIRRLKSRLQEKGLPHSCEENPKRALLLLCLQAWTREECRLALEVTSTAPSRLPSMLAPALAVLASSLHLFL